MPSDIERYDMADKIKYEKVTSPLGRARYPKITRADTKFYKEGEYKVDLIIEKDKAESFVKKIKAAQAKAKKDFPKAKKMAALPIKNEVDEDGNETGNVIIKFKTRNRLTKKGTIWDRKPVVFDKFGQRLGVLANGEPDEDFYVGGGSLIKVSAELFPCEVKGELFVGLQMVAVQVQELNSGAGRAEDFGFDVEDDDDDSEDPEMGTETEDEDIF